MLLTEKLSSSVQPQHVWTHRSQICGPDRRQSYRLQRGLPALHGNKKSHASHPPRRCFRGYRGQLHYNKGRPARAGDTLIPSTNTITAHAVHHAAASGNVFKARKVTAFPFFWVNADMMLVLVGCRPPVCRCLIACLLVCASAASVDHPAGEARVGERKDAAATTGRRQDDPAGSVGGIAVRGAHADVRYSRHAKKGR